MFDVSVVIPTFRRPHLLKKTISSVGEQDNSLNLAYEIIVVDNCPQKSAECTVTQMISRYDVPISYVSEPRQNISLARNAGIDQSKAQFIAMIDDDEEAASNWLDHLIMTIRVHDADVVMGPTTPTFDKEIPQWIGGRRHYSRHLSLPTGAVIRFGSSANFLMRSSTCVSNNNRFDPALGRSGGSDTDFFMRLSKSMGRKIVWCNEAVVKEFIPEDRFKLKYLLRREFRGTQVFVWSMVKYSEHPIATALYQSVFVGLSQIAIWSVPCLLLLPFRTAASFRVQRMLTRGLAKLFWSKIFRFNFY